MIHWCLLDKECREFSWALHIGVGKYHYQVNPPYSPAHKIFGGSGLRMPSITVAEITRSNDA